MRPHARSAAQNSALVGAYNVKNSIGMGEGVLEIDRHFGPLVFSLSQSSLALSLTHLTHLPVLDTLHGGVPRTIPSAGGTHGTARSPLSLTDDVADGLDALDTRITSVSYTHLTLPTKA